MDDLFRFMVLREPDPTAPGDVVDLGQADRDSRLLGRLQEAQRADDPAAAMAAVATEFVADQEFVAGPGDLQLGERLVALGAAIDEEQQPDRATTTRSIEWYFDQDAATVVASAEFGDEGARLRDSIVAAKLASATTSGLVDIARTMALVRRVADGDAALDEPGAIARARRALLVLPPEAVVPPPPAPTEPQPPAPPAVDITAQVARIKDLRAAIEAVRAAPSEEQPGEAAAQPERVVGDVVRSGVLRNVTSTLPAVARQALNVDGPLTMAQGETQLMEAFKGELAGIAKDTVTGGAGLGPIIAQLHLEPVTLPGEHDDATDAPPAVMNGVPATHGSIKPAGIGDLLVTRRHTIAYELGEIAHIENVATGETLVRQTRRLDTSETTTVTENERIEDEQRDLQTTARFDLHREADDVLRRDDQRVPGNPSSESYGSLVESGGFKQSSKQVAETFGRDVTSRAASRVTTRTRTVETTRVLRELEETATHTFATAAATPEIVVYQWVDQLVEAQVFSYGKRLMYDIVVPEPAAFLARALESGPREVPLPPRPAPFTLEPSLLDEWNWSYYVAGYGAGGVTPPPPPTVTVARTAQGIATNPFSDQDQLRFAMASSGFEVTIPDGYQATKVRARLLWSGWSGFVDVTVGHRAHRFPLSDGGVWDADLSGQTGTIPLTIMVPEGLAQWTVSFEIICSLTTERMDRWRLATHAAILAAARDRQDDYEQRLGRLRSALRLLTAGRTGARAVQTIRDELHKACVSVITNQHFDGLSAVGHSPQGYPQTFLPNLESYGRYVRFLEHAFEWEQMTWRYAPYFWGRKPYWIRNVLRDDPDPAFADFLQAGAARTLVPVRPGFEAAVLAFIDDGTVPTTAALTDVTSPTSLPLLQELHEPDLALEQGRPVGTPWTLRMPTTLVALRRDGTLPRWQMQTAADGTANWVSAPGDALP